MLIPQNVTKGFCSNTYFLYVHLSALTRGFGSKTIRQEESCGNAISAVCIVLGEFRGRTVVLMWATLS